MVLCALVVVICVLSVLYHRKRKQKHLRTIKPSPEDPESGKRAQSNCREALESSKNVGFVVPDLKKKQLYYRTEVVLGLDQTLLDSKKVSQIYQIYGTGIHQSRASRNRAKSAGPVLSRTDIVGRQPDTDMENQRDLKVVKDKELHARGAETEKDQRMNGGDSYEELFDQTKENSEELEETGVEDKLQRMSRMEKKQAEKVDTGNVFKTALEMQQKGKENSVMGNGEKEQYALEKSTTKQEFLHNDDDVRDVVEVKDGMPPLQQGNDAVQFLQDSETIPYLSIGTDPENQNPEQEQIPAEASIRPEPSKPIRRVLTWPPTAAQWKKQWAQTQQALSAFHNVTFVTGCEHHISSFPSSIPSSSPKSIPQSTGSRSVPGPKLPGEDFKTVEPLKKMCEAAIHSYIQSFPSSAQEISEAQSSINQNSLLNSKAYSDLVRGKLLSEERHLKPDHAKSVNSSEDTENMKRHSKGTKQTLNSEPVVSKSERRSRKRERERRKPLRKRDQSSSGSRAPPSGGSPSDDSLLVDNEYAFIDLLHEVVENQGRWTRERWRQSHMNKQKQKHALPPTKAN